MVYPLVNRNTKKTFWDNDQEDSQVADKEHPGVGKDNESLMESSESRTHLTKFPRAITEFEQQVAKS